MLRPRLFVIENVPDLIKYRGGRTLADLLGRLERPARRLRYRIEYKVYDAALFGTPQARRRVLILGVRYGDGQERLPEPGPDLAVLYSAIRHNGKIPKLLEIYRKALLDPDNEMLTSASQALSDLPQLGPGAPEVARAYATGPKNAFQRWARSGASELLASQFGKKRKLTRNSCRGISAVAVLDNRTAAGVTLKVYHNPFATNPIRYEAMAAIADEQFVNDDPHGQGFISMKPRKIEPQ
jgi:site-specific DNA-cytosine methylase